MVRADGGPMLLETTSRDGRGAVRRRAWVLRLGFVVLLLSALAGLAGEARAGRYAAIVVDANNGQVLYARNADGLRYPASLTKMMTLYLAFEALESGRLTLDDRIVFSARAAGQPPSKLGLDQGQSLTVEDAILALVTKSANDVAVALAERLGKSESDFAQLMTQKAQQLGMMHSRFFNASGLPNGRQRTTARDMATLARALLRDHPQYYGYFARETFTFNGRSYQNHNHLLGQFDGTDGIKTGYIDASGYNLVASVSRDGQRLIGVVFGGRTSASRDRQMRDLIDRGFVRLATYVAPSVPPLPLAKPAVTQAAAESLTTADGWKVQVGAFESYDVARQRALNAARAVPGFLRQPLIAVEATGSDDDRLYRAQLTPFDARRAELACQVLRQQRVDCFTIAPEMQSAENGLSG
jgi:D-alanyl-D-alanine carboxypeptidase